MAVYNYVALKNNKDVVKGKVEAANLKQARENVRKLGFLPTKIYEEEKDQRLDEKDCSSLLLS